MQSNFDRRRINGPDESFPPTFEHEDGRGSIICKPGQPRQGRAARDIRPICTRSLRNLLSNFILTSLFGIVLKPGLISQASGSAYIETERTKIACAVLVPFNLVDVILLKKLFFSATDRDNLKVIRIVKVEGLMLKCSLPLSRQL
jgi:hypothetical protein